MSFRNYYDSTYTRNSRDTGRSTPSAPAPTTVTAKYLTPASTFKSSSIPVRRDHSSTREETPISAIANRYSSYSKKEDKPSSKYDSYTKKDEKPTSKYDSYSKKEDKPTKYESYTKKDEKPASKYEKKDYSKLSLPILNTNRSRDVSPVSTSSKYSLSRSSRHTSPERKTKTSIKLRSPDPSSTDRDKDIPNKTDKSYTSLSSYKLYPRTSSYTRPSSRTEVKPEITVNRYAIANRLSSSSNYMRNPSEKTRSSVSPVINLESPKTELEKSVSPTVPPIAEEKQADDAIEIEDEYSNEESKIEEEFDENETETLTVITRHTSPTPPGSSVYVRARRADMAKTIEKTITRMKRKPKMQDKEIQSDRLDDPTRCSRFGSTARAAVNTWSLYTPNVSSYTGYAGRYSTQYSALRENNTTGYERSSRSRSNEPKDLPYSSSPNSHPEPKENGGKTMCNFTEKNTEVNPEIVTVYEHDKDNNTSEIIINVNLKLKKASNSPLVVTSQAELVSPEITITNSQLPQLPPQVPKNEGVIKTKKVKVRKSSAESSSDSSSSPKKKVIKKRSKSVSSTDSDQTSESKEISQTSPTVSPPKSISKIISNANIQNGLSNHKHSKSRESNSPESSSTLSTQSSVSEDEQTKSKTIEVSRTSADEVSIPTDRSGKQPSPAKGEGADEAKSFLIRALAPVTNLFKRHQDSGDSRWLENSSSESTGKDVSNLITESDRSSKNKSNNTSDIVASNDDHVVKLKAIRHIESGERAWWLDSESEKKSNSASISNEKQNSPSDKNIPRKIRHVESGERAWWLEANGNSDNKPESPSIQTTPQLDRSFIKCKFADDDKPWWLDTNANIPEGVECLTPPRKTSSESEKSEKFDFFKVRHIESGDKKDWWQTSSESSNKPENQNNLSKSSSDQKGFPLRRIRHVESGERPWWLSSSKNIPEGIEKLPTPPPQDSDSSDSEEVQVYVPSSQIPPFPLNLPDDEPLGDRRSPEGLETPREQENYGGRASPYENHRLNRQKGSNHLYRKEKYISRYTDIDDILGTCSQIYSPFMDSLLARRTGQVDDESECEEIDSTQVKIHDSTAQRPVIKKLRSRSEIIDCRDENQLDDVALQVFRDGEYGPYLDLDATLAEQEEDLEGLQDSRKNAIIVRTQLSVRVHALNERLLQSEGRELRRALFSLKQVLQTDDDLVHEFVANKGLDCLMQLGNVADHNYLDYILRALGQILLYVDGMHGVMVHSRCVQWLYTLVASHYRHVVKTALKLLLVFVEYTEENCLKLLQAISAVDGAANRPSWYNIMKILQDVDTSDTELLIYATSLINKCLNSTQNRDLYYDHVDALQAQGIDDVIRLYMAKQGTDLDLLRQLQIFEAVLLYEDGDETGTALKQLDESVISSIRRRSISAGPGERRRSKVQQMKEKEKMAHAPPQKDGDMKTRASQPLSKDKENQELSTALRKRRERCARRIHQITQQDMLNKSLESKNGFFGDAFEDNSIDTSPTTNGYRKLNGQDEERTLKTYNIPEIIVNGNQRYTNNKEIVLTKEHSIRDLAQRLTSPTSPSDDKPPRVVEMAGIVSKAKKELAKSQSKEVIKSPTMDIPPKPEVKVSENDLHWEELRKGCLNREYHLCDLDFSDLKYESDEEVPMKSRFEGAPPPPPAMPPQGVPLPGMPPPPPAPGPPPPHFRFIPPAPPPQTSVSDHSNNTDSSAIRKNKKTVKLFWREIQELPTSENLRSKAGGGFIWDDLPEIHLDTKMLEHLFESRTNDLIIKEKIAEPKRNLILDAKRSNAINIAMKKLPTPQTIKAAIMKMDATVIGREGIEKLLTMLPTDAEKVKIQEAQYTNPDLPLGSAEQFLLTLASISELESRLKLWVFKLDYENSEKEIAEPLMDLKQGIELLKVNKTFKAILSTLRTVGSFLNGSQVKGFRLEYLSKVMEVKDTVHKHPLLHHICEMIIMKFPDSTDFFSEVGPVIRASKVDFEVLGFNLQKLELDCKASWDHMKRVAKHDGPQIFKTKINEFLTDAAERIILLSIIKKRVMNRYSSFLLYLGVPPGDVEKTKPSDFLKVIAEFALEFRTSRERVLLQLEKRANHRERNKTRGKMIIDVGSYATKSGDSSADSALKELLKPEPGEDGMSASRRRLSHHTPGPQSNGCLSPEDEIIESLVRTATTKPRTNKRRLKIGSGKKIGFNRRTLSPPGQQTWPTREYNTTGLGAMQQR